MEDLGPCDFSKLFWSSVLTNLLSGRDGSSVLDYMDSENHWHFRHVTHFVEDNSGYWKGIGGG
jgi:hypothetical protein